MKIKLSKSQWSEIGERAGWMKTSQVAQTQPAQGQQPNPQLNARCKYMLETYNFITGKNIPVTPEGYDSIGGSKGIVAELTKDQNFENFILKVVGKTPQARQNLIGQHFVAISR